MYHLIVPLPVAVNDAPVWLAQIVVSLAVGIAVVGTMVTFKIVVALFVSVTEMVWVM